MKKMVGGCFMVGLLVNLLSSCTLSMASPEEQEEHVFISIDGNPVELVIDEYENPYLKQNTDCGVIYIPFTFPTEEDEIPRVYEAKNNAYVK